MIDIKKGAIALCLSGLAIGSTAGAALASTASPAATTRATTVQAAQVSTSWCGYQVVRAPDGLFVRTGPSRVYRVVGALYNGEMTKGECAKVHDWVHLTDMYHHYAGVSKNARGWSYGYYLSSLRTSSMCGYTVVRAPDGLFVRSGASREYRVVGALYNNERTTGSCSTTNGWVHLSDKYHHYAGVPSNARGWSYGYYLRK
jgi:uncharacterized protein YgiM (DUF1202 family)